MSDQFADSVKREVVATICGVGVQLSAEMWVLTGVESVGGPAQIHAGCCAKRLGK
jgi:hypothetical protein